MSSTVSIPKKLTKKDFDPGVDVRWCPGCGDYAILANMQRILPTFNKPKEQFVFVSGIGCSSRFPYYMNTYGFHTIHGRAPAIATGLKAYRPDLEVWVVTGDGDGLSIGGNHLMHAIRRNVDIKILLFNNRIYGLTKGQYSPTSEVGKKTKSTPMGSLDAPFKPLLLALAAEATFVARVTDTDAKLAQEIFTAAHEHKGTAFVEILQNCPVFNDGTFTQLTEKATKADTQLHLRAGEPMVFGAAKDRGIALRDGRPTTVAIGEDGITEADLLVHNPHDPNPALAFALASFERPHFPVPMGILRQTERPAYDAALKAQLEDAKQVKGEADLAQLLRGSDTWTVA